MISGANWSRGGNDLVFVRRFVVISRASPPEWL
jgi:hypothetical protein